MKTYCLIFWQKIQTDPSKKANIQLLRNYDSLGKFGVFDFFILIFLLRFSFGIKKKIIRVVLKYT